MRDLEGLRLELQAAGEAGQIATALLTRGDHLPKRLAGMLDGELRRLALAEFFPTASRSKQAATILSARSRRSACERARSY